MLIPAVIILISVTATVSDLNKCVGYNQDECFECCDRDKKDENIKLEKGDDLFFLAFGSTAGYDCKWLKFSADNITTLICCYTNSRPIRNACWAVENGAECRPKKEVIVIKDRNRKVNCTLQVKNVDTIDDGIYTSSIEWGGRKHILNVVKTYATERAQITKGEPIEFESFGATVDLACKWTKAGVDTETRSVCCYTHTGSNLCDDFENDPECHDVSEVKVIKEERHKQGKCTITIQDTTEGDSGVYSSSIEREKKFRLTVTPEKYIENWAVVLITVGVVIVLLLMVVAYIRYTRRGRDEDGNTEVHMAALGIRALDDLIVRRNEVPSTGSMLFFFLHFCCAFATRTCSGNRNEENMEMGENMELGERIVDEDRNVIDGDDAEEAEEMPILIVDEVRQNEVPSTGSGDEEMPLQPIPTFNSCRSNTLWKTKIVKKAGIKLNTLLSVKNNWGETPLHLACKHEQIQVFEYLMDNSVSVDEVTNKDNTALHYAAEVGNCEIVEKLLARGANIDAPNKNGETPIFNALKSEDVSTIEFLLKKGADIKVKNIEGHTPLHTALKKNKIRPKIIYMFHKKRKEAFQEVVNDTQGHSVLKMALEAGARDVVALILRTINVDILDQLVDICATFKNNWTLLHHAAAQGNNRIVEIIVQCDPDLVKKVINLQTTDEIDLKRVGNTALHKAIEGGNEEIVKLLISAEGVDLSKANIKGNTALHKAVEGGNEEIVKLLIETEGFDLSKPNIKGLTPILMAIQTKKTFNLFKTLFHAQFKQSKESNDFLNVKTAQDEDKEGETALRMAVRLGLYEIVKFLIEKGADYNERDQKRHPLLYTALMGGHPSIWKFLIFKKADFEEKFGEHEESYLHLAVGMKNKNAVQVILSYKRDEEEEEELWDINSKSLFNIKDKYDQTPKMKAQDMKSHYVKENRIKSQEHQKMIAIMEVLEASDPKQKNYLMTTEDLIERLKNIKQSGGHITAKKRKEMANILKNPSKDPRRISGIIQEEVSAAEKLDMATRKAQ